MRVAQITNPAIDKGLQNQSGISFFQSALPAFIGIALVIGSLVFFFTLIAGAIGWITSGGDKQAVETARGRITSAITGLVIMLITFAVVNVIENFFGVNILELDFGALRINP